MKVLFIYPNVGAQIGFNYGLAALSAVCKARGHETALINVNDKLYPELADDAEVVRRAAQYNPDAVGFSIVSQQWPLARRLAAALKAALSVPVIAGGVHVTMDTAAVMEDRSFDFAVAGEADDAFPALLDAIENGGDTTCVSNAWARRGDEVVANAVGRFPRFENLPPLDYDLFDFQKMTDAKDGWVGVVAGRGCPYRCTYCFNHAIVERYRRETGLSAAKLGYVRFMSVERVVENLRGLAGKYERITTFIFDDDTFTFRSDYVIEFCEAYKKSGIRIPFVVNAHVRAFNREVAGALKSAGCRILKFGIESGSLRVRREVLRRPMTDGKIEAAFCEAADAGLHTSAFLMIGLPTETPDELRGTVRMLGRIRPGRFRWSVFFPFPGTEAHRISERVGQLNHEKMAGIRSFMDESCLDFGEEQNLLVEKMNTAFPWFVNAETSLEVAPFYGERVREIEAMDRAEFSGFKKKFRELDRDYSARFAADGLEHYALKYNRFMGVSSGFFLAEQEKLSAHERNA